MGIIYINGGFKKAKQPVDIGQSNINISGGGYGLDISVEEGNLVISSQTMEPDKVVEDEVLNIG